MPLRTLIYLLKNNNDMFFLSRFIVSFLLLAGLSLQAAAQNPSCKVSKRDGDNFYFGKMYIPQGSGKYKLKRTLSDDGFVILYFGQLDRTKIYMKRLAVTEDSYYVDATDCSHAFVVRTNVADDVEMVPATAVDDEIIADNGSYYFDKALSVQNSFRYTEEEISNSDLQTKSTFKKKNIYVMAEPMVDGFAFKWLDQFGTTDNLPANSLYLTGAKTTAAPEIVLLWPDDDIEVITGIKSVQTDYSVHVKGAASDAIYNLQGQRVTDMQKGHIYIRNGRKFMAR